MSSLTLAFGKAYGGEDCLLMCLGSQRASLYKEGVDTKIWQVYPDMKESADGVKGRKIS